MVSDWQIDEVVRVIDGDTLTAIIERKIGELDGFEIIARSKRDAPAHLRLVHVDTPEKKEAGYADAREALEGWLSTAEGPRDDLRFVTEKKDSFGRYLADVYLAHDRSQTASDYLVRERGFPVWTR